MVSSFAKILKSIPSKLPPGKSGIFAENFFLDYFSNSLQKEATTIYEKIGKISKVGAVVPENQLRGYFILYGEKSNAKISFTLTPENPALIQEYHISLDK